MSTWQSSLADVDAAAADVPTELLLDAPEETVIFVLLKVETLLFPAAAAAAAAEEASLSFRRKVRFKVRSLGLSEALHGPEEVAAVVLLEVEALVVAEERFGLGRRRRRRRAILGLLLGHLFHFLFVKSGRFLLFRLFGLGLGLVLLRNFFWSLLKNLLLGFRVQGQEL